MVWGSGHPANEVFRSCLYTQKVKGYIGNDNCAVPYCHFCRLTFPSNFKLTGLCHGSMVDSEYFLNFDQHLEALEFSGFGLTDIKKNYTTNHWEIVDSLDSSIVRARTVEKSSPDREYPLGVMEWISLNDNCGSESVKELKISQCKKVKQT